MRISHRGTKAQRGNRKSYQYMPGVRFSKIAIFRLGASVAFLNPLFLIYAEVIHVSE
jgi:hypothetical protein